MKYDIDIDSYIGYPISKEWLRSQLKGFAGKPVAVRINSYGGDVMTALDILQQFKDHGNVTAYIFGMTASAATILACGAKHVAMSKYALMLIHRCSGWSDAWGQYNAEELAAVIKQLQSQQADLETIDRVICSVYADRTGKKAADIAKTMEEGAWLDADQCKALGLIDEIIEEGEAATITDSVRHQFAACGLPLPVQSNQSPQSIQSKETKETNQPLKNSPKMNTEKLSHLAALIDLAPVTAEADGSAKFTDEQLTALEGKLADAKAAAEQAAADAAAKQAELEQSITALTAEKTALETAKAELETAKKDLETKNAELTEQVKALKAADGADTNNIEGAAEQNAPTDALAMFNAVKPFI